MLSLNGPHKVFLLIATPTVPSDRRKAEGWKMTHRRGERNCPVSPMPSYLQVASRIGLARKPG